MTDIRKVFPNAHERVVRRGRGHKARTYVVGPSFDEIIFTVYGEPLLKHQTVQGGSRNFFYLLRKGDLFGYHRLRELEDQPFNKFCNSFENLRTTYRDVCRSPVWRDTIPSLVEMVHHKKKIPGHNQEFIDLVKNKFKDAFEVKPVAVPDIEEDPWLKVAKKDKPYRFADIDYGDIFFDDP